MKTSDKTPPWSKPHTSFNVQYKIRK